MVNSIKWGSFGPQVYLEVIGRKVVDINYKRGNIDSMKLVMTYYVNSGQDSWEVVQPFEYDSAEKAYCDLMDLTNEYRKLCESYYNHSSVWISGDIKFADLDLNLSNFVYSDDCDLNIQTLEEWFEKNKPQ